MIKAKSVKRTPYNGDIPTIARLTTDDLSWVHELRYVRCDGECEPSRFIVEWGSEWIQFCENCGRDIEVYAVHPRDSVQRNLGKLEGRILVYTKIADVSGVLTTRLNWLVAHGLMGYMTPKSVAEVTGVEPI